ncbi:hypothetical protein CKAN_01307700 [Cinnamomum micranthum f. kanehirae]|uniref:Uncharacterized protein n=1 Tax=Cinnamomum micranthum f. kanehirae TaxID=337451 RepID=A0A443P0G6_9MAGN|nr:hypothetical protein CKAN_01307700 [Cinnamomum micranthum f. kanehirae]
MKFDYFPLRFPMLTPLRLRSESLPEWEDFGNTDPVMKSAGFNEISIAGRLFHTSQKTKILSLARVFLDLAIVKEDSLLFTLISHPLRRDGFHLLLSSPPRVSGSDARTFLIVFGSASQPSFFEFITSKRVKVSLQCRSCRLVRSDCPPFGRSRVEQIFFRCRSGNSSSFSSSSHFLVLFPLILIGLQILSENQLQELRYAGDHISIPVMATSALDSNQQWCVKKLFLFLHPLIL